MQSKQLICWTLVLGLIGVGLFWSGAGAADSDSLHSSAEQRNSVDVTVYNHDLALIQEIRRLDLPQGEFELEFADVPAKIIPASLLINQIGSTGLEILEQNYEFDLMSRQKILQKYVGRRLSWLQEDGSRLEGTLLGLSDGPVFEVAGEVVFEVPGRLALPALPDNLRARPTLVWLARNDRAGVSEIATSYLTRGFSWKAEYVLDLNPAGERADLQAWVSVDNRSGAGFTDARLLLVAGDIHRVQPSIQGLEKALVMRAGAADGFEESALYDYHLYTLGRPTTLLDNQTKQLALFDAKGISVEKHYRLQGHGAWFRYSSPRQESSKVEVSYRFGNRKDNELGLPLPAGVFRVYGQSENGTRQLLGEDRIDHTPRDEEVELQVGKAFDLVAERVKTDSKKIADNVTRSTFEITLRNHRDDDVVVEVLESVGGYWDVIQSSHAARKVSAQEMAFDVSVPADGESVLTYTVEVRY